MKIGFLPDIILHDEASVCPELVTMLRSNNFNCVNFEAPFCQPQFPAIKKGINLYHHSQDLSLLHELNIRFVNLANNHIFDFGSEGFDYTLTQLKSENIDWFGAGGTLSEATRPICFEHDGHAFSFFGFAWDFTDAINATVDSYGTAPVDFSVIESALTPYRNTGWRIAYFHFGTEYEDYPEPYHKKIIEHLFEKDLLDVAIGGHPHCIQGYKESTLACGKKLAFYSLGNFILPEIEYGEKILSFPEISKLGYLVNIDFSDEPIWEIVPFKITNEGKHVTTLSPAERIDFDKKLKEISQPLMMPHSSFGQFYFRNRKRKFRPYMTKWTGFNRLQIAAYHLIEKSAVTVTKRLGLHGLVRKAIHGSYK